ncbi:UvrB/UvrC motif-containing protein [Virgibacillus sp. NKC19-3]|uniref:UvrB/UvrC motif-containing protein n=1 Tax=Virgibacillus saliphilus TaxID=2831674 RepID=UPI001C9B197C|nr:UvrB/UvrC motif-containing protein [Virgibacillus sp. NKC19-3]MBY7141656.1 UvrB/UvrC motif-containing protein [Virgibacillus sp. NKC19-3]
MQCQECQQRPATLHFTQVINGTKTEIHVCEVCAKEKGYMTYPEEGYSLHNLLTGLFNFDSAMMESQQSNSYNQVKELKCPQCGMSLSTFKKVGKFGCATCYDTFSERLDPILRRVHSGNTKHYGKIPKRMGGDLHTKKQLESYKAELQQLIEDENFEEAAQIRDKIKALQNQSDGSKAGDDT